MHPDLLKFYEKELHFVRHMGKEFAERHESVARQLGMEGSKCADPYVERLLEGFAFLAARVQLKIHDEYPRFTQNLLQMVYPHYLAPTPSMAIMHFDADLNGGVTAQGATIPRGSRLLSSDVAGRSRCDFRTAHDVHLWPVKLHEAEYLSAGVANSYTDAEMDIKCGIRLRLQPAQGINLQDIHADSLEFYLDGSNSTPYQIYELLFAHCIGVVIRPVSTSASKPSWELELPLECLQEMGFESDQALLPYTDVSFQGYRLLQEYFALPQRFLFFRLQGLAEAFKRCQEGEELEIALLFNDDSAELDGYISKDNFVLHCTPAINLFPKRGNRIHLTPKSAQQHVIMDRTNQQDFEVYALTEVVGIDADMQVNREFKPFYECGSHDSGTGKEAYYTVKRKPTITPTHGSADKGGSDYLSTEVYLTLVDATEQGIKVDTAADRVSDEATNAIVLKQLAIQALCTNRDLPIKLKDKVARFTMEESAPVKQVKCMAGPTAPIPPDTEGENAWKLISHLSLNYLSLADQGDEQGAQALRELLELYSNTSNSNIQKRIKGIQSIASKQVVNRIPGAGPITFGRGVEITLKCRERAFEGSGVFLLGAVLEQFFGKYVSLNSFIQARLETEERGVIKQWSPRMGTRAVI